MSGLKDEGSLSSTLFCPPDKTFPINALILEGKVQQRGQHQREFIVRAVHPPRSCVAIDEHIRPGRHHAQCIKLYADFGRYYTWQLPRRDVENMAFNTKSTLQALRRHSLREHVHTTITTIMCGSRCAPVSSHPLSRGPRYRYQGGGAGTAPGPASPPWDTKERQLLETAQGTRCCLFIARNRLNLLFKK